MRELLTSYGPVALIWFDTPRMMTKERGQRFTDIVRQLQPKTLIDGRLGVAGDYVSTGDNVIPGTAPADAWEVPATINHTWGFRKDDRDWKSPGDITFKLVDIVSKGGNYLLNVGPMADGVIPPASQDSLREVGKWLKVNGEAVYGAGPSPWGDEVGEPSAKGTKDLRGQPLFLVAQRMARDHQAGQGLLDVLHGAARAVRAAAHEERGQARLSPGRRRARRDQGGGRADLARHPASDPGSDGDRRRGRDRGRQRHEVSTSERREPPGVPRERHCGRGGPDRQTDGDGHGDGDGARARTTARIGSRSPQRLAEPVLTNLAAGTLRARMPVEEAEGAGRRSVTYLEAFGRLLAGIAPWLELPADATRGGPPARALRRPRPAGSRRRRRSVLRRTR